MRAPRFLIPPPTAWRARRARCLSDPACGQIEFPMDLEDGFATWLAVMARYAETAVQNGGEDPARACARARGRLTCRATAGADDALVAACKVARRGGGAGLAFEDLLMDLSDGRWPPPPFPLAFPYTRQPFSYPPANCIFPQGPAPRRGTLPPGRARGCTARGLRGRVPLSRAQGGQHAASTRGVRSPRRPARRLSPRHRPRLRAHEASRSSLVSASLNRPPGRPPAASPASRAAPHCT